MFVEHNWSNKKAYVFIFLGKQPIFWFNAVLVARVELGTYGFLISVSCDEKKIYGKTSLRKKNCLIVHM